MKVFWLFVVLPAATLGAIAPHATEGSSGSTDPAGAKSVGGAPSKLLEMCPIARCKCNPANTYGSIEIVGKYTKDACMCSCGKEEGEDCLTTGQCVVGKECVAPTKITLHSNKKYGICQSKCHRKTCPQFTRCKIVGGKPTCPYVTFTCDTKTVIPVKARILNGAARIFTNQCFLVNANAAILTQNPNAAPYERVVSLVK